MIEKNTLSAIEYDKLDTASVKLEVYENSPLAEVVETLSVAALINRDTTDMPSTDEVMAYINAQESHTACISDIKTLGVKAVRQLSDLVKNTVSPHIRSVVESVQSRINDEGGMVSYWSVSPVTLHPLLNNMIVSRLVANLRGVMRVKESTLGNGIGDFDADYLKSTVAMGANDFAELLEHAAGSTYGDTLYFAREVLSGRSTVKPDTTPEALVVSFIAALATKTPPANTTISLSKWELNRTVLINTLGYAIIDRIDGYERQVQQGLLYSAPKLQREGVILVNDKVYRGMIDKGLTPEAVIGNELLGRKYLPFQMTSEAAIKECTSAYNLDRRAKQAAAKQEERTYRIRAIQDALRNDLNKIAEKESWPVDGDSRDKAWGRLKTTVEKVLAGPHKDSPTEDLVAAIILSTWYAHTDAWRLIDIASRIAKEDPELKPDELFALAKIEYTAKWLSSQIYMVGNVNDADSDVEVPYVTASVS